MPANRIRPACRTRMPADSPPIPLRRTYLSPIVPAGIADGVVIRTTNFAEQCDVTVRATYTHPALGLSRSSVRRARRGRPRPAGGVSTSAGRDTDERNDSKAVVRHLRAALESGSA